MRVICSYCKSDLGEKPPLDDPQVTHAMCADCYAWFTRVWNGITIGESLDDIDIPIALVQDDARLIAANRAMETLLGKSNRHTAGLLMGEVMECVHAREPGGCGGTVHCASCTIRNAVYAAKRGQDQIHVPAFLDKDGGRQTLTISTRLVGEVVEVRVESAEDPEDQPPSSDREAPPTRICHTEHQRARDPCEELR